MTQLGLDYEFTKTEQQILSLLQKGRQNALSVKRMVEQTGLREDALRQKVRHLIDAHDILICSVVMKPAGYFYPVSAIEIEQGTKSLRHRGLSILARAAKLQKISIVEIFNQTLLEFEDVKK